LKRPVRLAPFVICLVAVSSFLLVLQPPNVNSSSQSSTSSASSFQYSLTTMNDTVIVGAGCSLTIEAQANLISGTASPVALSIAFVPAAASSYFIIQSPVSVLPPSTFVVVVQPSATTPIGNYTLQIVGSTSQGLMESLEVHVAVSAACPSSSSSQGTSAGTLQSVVTTVSSPASSSTGVSESASATTTSSASTAVMTSSSSSQGSPSGTALSASFMLTFAVSMAAISLAFVLGPVSHRCRN